ncbi:MAG: tRNA (adenosine(37)-N6)-dimethylallyltransferase MiaA [Planctomycetaceae bacterium]|nr:tRNA (adenosine(37)-N6)-dimethylallyltransferase MiaA [Planctomycetaceae bacterium]
MQFDPTLLQQCRFLAGPTACGKSETALALAKRIDVEIVALDSMSLYRGMDMGTAKPSPSMRNAVPHHLIDVIDPHQEYSVADYVSTAAVLCSEIVSPGRVPLFVGVTGLYLRAVLRGVFAGPAADWEFRRNLEREAASHTPDFLHRRLREVDPTSADRLHPNDQRRVIRALEVLHVTGRPLSQQQSEHPLSPDERPQHVHWLSPPRDWLRQRIDARVHTMIDAGLVDEVRELLSAQHPMSRTALQALGYKEVIDHLEGRATLDEAIETIQRRTRQFAKRQHTWFRNLEECAAVEISGCEPPDELAERLLNVAGS